jgi:tRNA (guanine-N1)-methyltransferase
VKITLITAFPDLLRTYLGASILGRGIASGKLCVEVLDLRDFAEGSHRQVDDFSFGGGGMVLMPEPLLRALERAQGDQKAYVLYPSPQGTVLHQELVEDIAQQQHLVIICGHYEGVDERFVSEYVNLEISMGDFVLTGGELPALALVDALARLIPGVVGREEAVQEDSFYRGMLDNAHYTRPASWRGKTVPSVLTSGNAPAIKQHRRREAALRTLRRRPDVLGRAGIGPYLSHSVYAAFISSNACEDANCDLQDIACTCQIFGVRKLLVVAALAEQRKQIKNFTADWHDSTAALIKIFPTLQKAVAWVEEKEKERPMTIAVSARGQENETHWLTLKRRILEMDVSPLFLFGDSNTPEDVFSGADSVIRPIQREQNHGHPISARITAGIVFDRFFGWR